jgi:anti-anti-sigma regulatory factor
MPLRKTGMALRISRAADRTSLRIAGDIDEFSYDELVAALAGFAGGRDDIHIDMAGVESCDLTGLRALVLLAADSRQDGAGGRRVILHGLPAHLKSVLEILGWDTTAGLSIE